LTPIFGLPLYIAFRPQGWKWDTTVWREALLTQLQICPNCQNLNASEHVCCVYCGERLQVTCRECGKAYASAYEYCPECGAPHLEN